MLKKNLPSKVVSTSEFDEFSMVIPSLDQDDNESLVLEDIISSLSYEEIISLQYKIAEIKNILKL